jgi:mannose-6-phosphate isomerase-like protein (cupin superfamily)
MIAQKGLNDKSRNPSKCFSRTSEEAVRFSGERMAKVNLCETDKLFCDVYGLEPGQGQRVHAHQDADKIYVVLEGSGTFRIGSEEQELGSETVVLAPSGVEHGVKNTGEVRLTLLVFMAPNPNVV